VAIHMYSPASAGLFQKALMESNPWALPLRTEDDMYGLAGVFDVCHMCMYGCVWVCVGMCVLFSVIMFLECL